MCDLQWPSPNFKPHTRFLAIRSSTCSHFSSTSATGPTASLTFVSTASLKPFFLWRPIWCTIGRTRSRARYQMAAAATTAQSTFANFPSFIEPAYTFGPFSVPPLQRSYKGKSPLNLKTLYSNLNSRLRNTTFLCRRPLTFAAAALLEILARCVVSSFHQPTLTQPNEMQLDIACRHQLISPVRTGQRPCHQHGRRI